MKKIVFIYLSLTFFFFLNSSCFPVKITNGTEKTSAGPIYNPYVQQLNPQYFVFNSTNNKSRLYLKLNLSELMFSPIGANKSYISKVKIEYKIFQIDDLVNLVDSASVVFEIKKRKNENSAITYININDKGLNKFYIQINTTDLFKRSKAEEFILVDRGDETNGQNFLVNSSSTNYPSFSNFFNKEQALTIQYNKQVDSLIVRYFKEKAPLPNPPFSSSSRTECFSYSDSTWKVGGKDIIPFSETKSGFYYLQVDSTLKSGLGLLNVGNNYPNIKFSEELLYPLEYLTSTNEFNVLKASDNKKYAIDQFWVSCGKNTNRARELIRIYYNRTLFANLYFTSFTEGWRTDRGMIYIIFGPPKAVQNSAAKEIWFYYDRNNQKYLQFIFNKYLNQYSDNDYVLERHIDFKTFWFQAIDSWRSGKVYTVFD